MKTRLHPIFIYSFSIYPCNRATTESKLVLFPIQQASKSREDVLEQGIVTWKMSCLRRWRTNVREKDLALVGYETSFMQKWSGVAVYYRLLGAGQNPETV